MFGGRGLILVKLTRHLIKNQLLQNGRHNFQKQITRDSHIEYYYRKSPTPSPKSLRVAEWLGGVIWWWLIWHFLTDYHELIEGSPFPDPSSFTDEELGIPPDDED